MPNILPSHNFYVYRLRKDGSHIKVGRIIYHWALPPVNDKNRHKVFYCNSDMSDTFFCEKVVNIWRAGKENK